MSSAVARGFQELLESWFLPLSLLFLTRNSRRRKDWYRLFLNLSTVLRFVRAVDDWRRYGMSPLDQRNGVRSSDVAQCLRRYLACTLFDAVWAASLGQYQFLLEHHLVQFLFFPYAFARLPTQVLTLSLVEGAAVVELIRSVRKIGSLDPRLDSRFKRSSLWWKLIWFGVVRLPIMVRLFAKGQLPHRAFALWGGAYTLLIQRRLLMKLLSSGPNRFRIRGKAKTAPSRTRSPPK